MYVYICMRYSTLNKSFARRSACVRKPMKCIVNNTTIMHTGWSTINCGRQVCRSICRIITYRKPLLSTISNSAISAYLPRYFDNFLPHSNSWLKLMNHHWKKLLSWLYCLKFWVTSLKWSRDWGLGDVMRHNIWVSIIWSEKLYYI